MPAPRREFGLVLLAGAAGSGLVVLAVRQAWAHAQFTPPRPLPAQDITVTGQQLVPLAGALALAALACLATAWRGPRWPVMSARFERSAPARRPGADSATMWESLSRDVDPTVDD